MVLGVKCGGIEQEILSALHRRILSSGTIKLSLDAVGMRGCNLPVIQLVHLMQEQ